MKYRFLLAAGLLVVLASLLAMLPTRVDAQEPTQMVRFGIVDVELIERDALMNKDIGGQINELRRKLSEEIKSEESDLRKASAELQRQKVLLSQDAFDQEARKFRQRELEFQKKIQDRNNDFNRVRIFARNAFAKELNHALTDITKEYKFTLILRRSQVLVSADFLDITTLVLDRLNKNMPKFTIPKDVTAPATADSGAKSSASKAAPKAAPTKKK